MAEDIASAADAKAKAIGVRFGPPPSETQDQSVPPVDTRTEDVPGGAVALNLPAIRPSPWPETRKRGWADAILGWYGGQVDILQGGGRAAGAVIEDVTKGIASEGVGAVARGVAGAVENMAASADDFGTWLNEHVADLTIGDREDAIEGNPLRALSEIAADAKARPFGERETGTGRLIEGVTQFLTSRGMVSKMAPALGTNTSWLTRVIGDMVAGGIGFDPKAPRLSNVIDEAAPNPLTAFLKSKPDDSAAEGRLKSALETGGLAALADGAVKAFKVLRANAWASRAKDSGAPQTALTTVEHPSAMGRDWLALGDETAPIAPKLDEKFTKQAARWMKGDLPDSPIKINMARAADDAQVQDFIGKLSKFLPEKEVEKFTVTEAGARELGLTGEQLAAGIKANIFDARQITAGRMVVRSAAEQAMAFAEYARMTGRPEDMAKGLRALGEVMRLQQIVTKQQSEIGRALSAQRIVAKSEPDAVKAFMKLIDQHGGQEATLDLMEKIATLGDPGKVGQLAAEIAKGTFRDKFSFGYMNILVSNPKSHVANIVGNTSAGVINIWERWLAGQIRSVIGGEGTNADEAFAYLYGTKQGFTDGMQAAGRALRTGERSFGATKDIPVEPSTIGRIASPNIEQRAASYLSRMLPSRWLGAEDEIFKWLNYRGELNALAVRKAAGEGLSGPALYERTAELAYYPTAAMHEEAVAAALKSTFNAPLSPRMQSLARFINQVNIEIRPGVELPVGRLFVPFISTPTNIAKWTVERLPILNLISREVRADLAAGGARADMRMAQMATGAMLTSLSADLALSGVLTGGGPRDPKQFENLRMTGWRPDSIRIGDTYYSVARLDTPMQLMSIVPSAMDIMMWAKEEDAQDLGSALGLALTRAVSSKTYMKGISSLLDAVAYPERYGEKFVQRFLGSFVPGIGAQVESLDDPTVREVRTVMDGIRQRTPGLSDSLPPRVDRWGEDVKVDGAWLPFVNEKWAAAISPISVSRAKDSPIDHEILRLRIPISKIGESTHIAGTVIDLTPEEQYRLAKLRGKEVQIGGKTLYETLDDMVQGNGREGQQYARLPDEMKGPLIQDVVNRFGEVAKVRLMEEFPEIRDIVEGAHQELKKRAERARMPVLQ